MRSSIAIFLWFIAHVIGAGGIIIASIDYLREHPGEPWRHLFVLPLLLGFSLLLTAAWRPRYAYKSLIAKRENGSVGESAIARLLWFIAYFVAVGEAMTAALDYVREHRDEPWRHLGALPLLIASALLMNGAWRSVRVQRSGVSKK